MLDTLLRLGLLCALTSSTWPQARSDDGTKTSSIRSAKDLLVSSLDSSLPKITLEYFLQYEGGGVPVFWEAKHCGAPSGNSSADRGRISFTCVQANMDTSGGSVSVLLSMEAGDKGSTRGPSIVSLTVVDAFGRVHALRRLGEVPKELHRPVPKGPRDLPMPVGRLRDRPVIGRVSGMTTT